MNNIPNSASYLDQVEVMCNHCNDAAISPYNQCYVQPSMMSASANTQRCACQNGVCTFNGRCGWRQLGKSGVCQMTSVKSWGLGTHTTKKGCEDQLKLKYSVKRAFKAAFTPKNHKLARANNAGADIVTPPAPAPVTPPTPGCKEVTDPTTGAITEMCDITSGGGWSSNGFPGQLYDCNFVQEGAVYPTLAACMADNPGPAPTAPPSNASWFTACTGNNVNNCYFNEPANTLDNCLAQVFTDSNNGTMSAVGPKAGKNFSSPAMKLKQQCPYFKCSSASHMGANGRRSFKAADCKCVTK